MEAILNWIWQGSLVALAGGVLLALLGRLSAAVRYWFCWTTLLLVFTAPVAGLLWSARAVIAGMQPAPQDVPPVFALPPGNDPAVLAVLLWLAWISVAGSRAAVDLMRVRRALRAGVPFPDDRQRRLAHWNAQAVRRVRLVLSTAIPAAAVLGVRSPVIAVSPALLQHLSDDELDMILVHELAHVERRDALANVIQVALSILAGWHPGVWWLGRRLHVEREAACDERTVHQTRSPRAYAACLVKLAELQLAWRGSLPVPAVLPSSRIGGRVLRLLRPRRTSAGVAALAASAAAVTLAGLTIVVGGVRLVVVRSPELPIPRLAVAGDTLRLDAFRVIQAPATLRESSRPAPRTPSAVRSVAGPSAATASLVRPTAIAARTGAPDALPAPIALVAPPALGAPAAPGGRIAPEALISPMTLMAPPKAPRESWLLLADAGLAVGTGSQQVAVKTARFFARAGRKIAGAF